jgi:hypothetical protein
MSDNLEIDGETPEGCFARLIEALSKKSNSRIAVLIDEYDFPFAEKYGDLALAEANATIIGSFLAALKKPNVSPLVRFTMVAGITLYPFSSMYSGPDHFTDISLDPGYAGVCGFTLEELDSLFSDRLEETLAHLKNERGVNEIFGVETLKNMILAWHDARWLQLGRIEAGVKSVRRFTFFSK